jgi:hypothetical protein
MTMIINDNGTEREATETEIAYYNTWKLELETKAVSEAEVDAVKAAAREALLARLGITAEEAQLLLGGN